MKKILCIILSLIFVLSLCACGNTKDNKEPDTNPPVNSEQTNEDAPMYPEDFQNKELTLIEDSNIETLQGKIDAYYQSHTYRLLKVGNSLYEYNGADDLTQEDSYCLYDISDYNSVVYYKANGMSKDSTIVVDDKDGKLTAIIAIKRDAKTHTVKINKISLDDIKAEEIVECESSNENNVITVVYKRNNQIKYLIKYLDGKVFQSGNIEDLIEEEDKAYGLSDFIYANKDYLYALNDKHEIRTFELRCWKQDDDKYWTACYINDINLNTLEGWNKFVSLTSAQTAIVCQDNEPDTLKAYIQVGDWSNHKYDLAGSIKLPKTYTGANIKETYELLNQVIVRFDDGEYYLLNCAFGEKEMRYPLSWTKLSGFTNIAKDYQIDMYGADMCLLSSDGKLYLYSLMF